MADIAAFLAKIRTAIYGEEVRSSIADAIEAVNEEGTSGGGGGGGGEQVVVIGGTDYSKLNWVTLYSRYSFIMKMAKQSGIVYISIDGGSELTIENVRQTGGIILTPEQIASYFDRTGLQSNYVAHGVCHVVRNYEDEGQSPASRDTVYSMPMDFTLFTTSETYGASLTFTRPDELYDIPYEEIGDSATLHGVLSFPDPAPTSGDASWTQVYESTGTHHKLGDGVEYYNNGGVVFLTGHGNGFVFASNQFSALLDVLLTDRDIWFPVVIDNQYAAAGFMIRQGQYNRTIIGINATNISDGEHTIYFNVSYPTPAEFGAVEAGT